MKQLSLILLVMILMISGCSEKNDDPEIHQPSHIEPTSDLYSQNFPTIYDVEDNYIPPLNTMVNFKTDYPEIDEIMIELEPVMSVIHKSYDAHHYYKDDQDDLIANVALINDYYNSKESIEVSDELIGFITKSLELSTLTEGYFNPFLGIVSELYDGRFSPFPVTNTDPDEEALEQALGCVVRPDEFRDVLEINGNSLTFHQYKDCEKVMMDFGASAKGSATDILADQLENLEYDYVLDAGTSSIVTNSEEGISVGIRSPYNKVSSIYSLNLTEGWRLSTSGDDSSYYLLEEDPTVIRCHILDPETGISNTTYRSVTVLSPDNMISDALSTALFNMDDVDMILQTVNRVKDYYDIEIEFALLKETDSEKQLCDLLVSSGFRDFIKEDYVSSNIDQIIVLGE